MCVRLDNTRQQARTKPPAEYMAEAGCRQTAEIGKNMPEWTGALAHAVGDQLL
jgi:hypothetical protein